MEVTFFILHCIALTHPSCIMLIVGMLLLLVSPTTALKLHLTSMIYMEQWLEADQFFV
jgi:hypothetical protein